jgi:hypothetical protein
MKGFQRCDNGHFYKESKGSCPHCPAGNSDMNKTNMASSGGSDMDKTQVFGTANNAGDMDKTQVFGSNNSNTSDDGKTQVFGTQNNEHKPKSDTPDFSRTFIGGVASQSDTDNPEKKEKPRASRKITGWIVSFTLDSMGVDYRIFEGNNTIGRDPSNSISITKDSTISSKHANILHKKGKFWIKDEMAANGTFLNGEEIEIEKAYSLNDGDEIRLGDTVFRFKSCN